MNSEKTLTFYLSKRLLKQVDAKQNGFVSKVARVAETSGFQVRYEQNSKQARIASMMNDGYAMFHMDDPFHDRALTMRKVYSYPFWQIEKDAKRWEWAVAKRQFEPTEIDQGLARDFVENWRKWLFQGQAENPMRSGFVYVPLQGRVLDNRSFQTMSPLDMLRETLGHEQQRPIIATLHPNENYSTDEIAELETLINKHPQLKVTSAPMAKMLAECDYVVAENSSAAFFAHFFGKPSIHFAKIDFHHAGLNVGEIGVSAAFEQITNHSPNHEAYLYWFWQIMAINAGRADVSDRIRMAMQNAGWPM
ncbi:MAG: hypothetical protein P8P66_08180 [Paracoccaceae bacterium]|nr:hypothetical protein [Paracoccaceae bacterium]